MGGLDKAEVGSVIVTDPTSMLLNPACQSRDGTYRAWAG